MQRAADLVAVDHTIGERGAVVCAAAADGEPFPAEAGNQDRIGADAAADGPFRRAIGKAYTRREIGSFCDTVRAHV